MTNPELNKAIGTAQVEKKIGQLEAAPQVSPSTLGAAAIDPKATGYNINAPVKWDGNRATVSMDADSPAAQSPADAGPGAGSMGNAAPQAALLALLQPSETSPKTQAQAVFSLAGRSWNRLRQAQRNRIPPVSMRPGIGRRSPGRYKTITPASAAQVSAAARKVMAHQQTVKPQVTMTFAPPAGGTA